jgi:hypothetical protein
MNLMKHKNARKNVIILFPKKLIDGKTSPIEYPHIYPFPLYFSLCLSPPFIFIKTQIDCPLNLENIDSSLKSIEHLANNMNNVHSL